MEFKCQICEIKLTKDELLIYKFPKESVLLCRKHHCLCYPTTPWNWAHTCPDCNQTTICKSCYCDTEEDRICRNCYKLK